MIEYVLEIILVLLVLLSTMPDQYRIANAYCSEEIRGVPFAKSNISKSTNNASATSNPFYFCGSQWSPYSEILDREFT
jgi:hypothetical protein